MSWAVCDVLRDLGLPPVSPTRTCDELGVGSGEFEGVRLGPGIRMDSSDCSGTEEVAMGGNEGEKMDGGREADF